MLTGAKLYKSAPQGVSNEAQIDLEFIWGGNQLSDHHARGDFVLAFRLSKQCIGKQERAPCPECEAASSVFAILGSTPCSANLFSVPGKRMMENAHPGNMRGAPGLCEPRLMAIARSIDEGTQPHMWYVQDITLTVKPLPAVFNFFIGITAFVSEFVQLNVSAALCWVSPACAR